MENLVSSCFWIIWKKLERPHWNAIKVNSLRILLKIFGNFNSNTYILKTNENYAVIQREYGEYGSFKDTHANTPIKVVNYKFTMLLFFREMSDNRVE